MDTNFIYTGGPLNLMHERAISSAIATQKSERTILWWNGQRPPISIPGLELREYLPRNLPKFSISGTAGNPDRDPEHWRNIILKDVMLWELAATHGGLFLDLDTVCLRDVTCLLAGHEMVSPIDVPWDGEANTVGWRNAAILIARAGSQPVMACLMESIRRVNETGTKDFFSMGPKLISDVLNNGRFPGVYTPPYRMLGAFGGGVEAACYLAGAMELPANARVIHWFSSSKELTGYDPAAITTRTRVAPPRDQTGALFTERRFNRGVEVGVQRGEFAHSILSRWPGHLTLVDAWRHFPKDQYDDPANGSDLEHLQNMAATIQTLRPFRGRWDIVRGLSVEEAKGFADGHFDFVYLDANHSYQAVLDDLKAWVPKVREGGIFCGHDYLDRDWFQVRSAVNDHFGRPPDLVTDEMWPSFYYQL